MRHTFIISNPISATAVELEADDGSGEKDYQPRAKRTTDKTEISSRVATQTACFRGYE